MHVYEFVLTQIVFTLPTTSLFNSSYLSYFTFYRKLWEGSQTLKAGYEDKPHKYYLWNMPYFYDRNVKNFWPA